MKTTQILASMTMLFAILFSTSGCGETTAVAPKYDSTPFMLANEPTDPLDVIAARETLENKDDVVIVGRIGGDMNPWVENAAAFWIIDSSKKSCLDECADGEPCGCKTPWDYCCETDLAPAMALVKFVDANGKVIPHDAKANFHVKELDTVVVKGTAKRDEGGNLTILASGMFVRK